MEKWDPVNHPSMKRLRKKMRELYEIRQNITGGKQSWAGTQARGSIARISWIARIARIALGPFSRVRGDRDMSAFQSDNLPLLRRTFKRETPVC